MIQSRGIPTYINLEKEPTNIKLEKEPTNINARRQQPTLPKIFYSLVKGIIGKQTNNIYVPNQQAFIRGRSTLSILINYENYMSESLV